MMMLMVWEPCSIRRSVAARDLVLPAGPGRTLRVRRRSILAVSPFLSHRDTRLFPDAPGAFRPHRFSGAGNAAASATEAGPMSQSQGPDGGSTAAAAAGGFSTYATAPAARITGDTGAQQDVNGGGGLNAGCGGRPEVADELGAIPGVSHTGMAFGGGRFRCGTMQIACVLHSCEPAVLAEPSCGGRRCGLQPSEPRMDRCLPKASRVSSSRSLSAGGCQSKRHQPSKISRAGVLGGRLRRWR